MIAHILRKLRERKARRRLDEIVRQTRASYACESYRRHREAALKARSKPASLLLQEESR